MNIDKLLNKEDKPESSGSKRNISESPSLQGDFANKKTKVDSPSESCPENMDIDKEKSPENMDIDKEKSPENMDIDKEKSPENTDLSASPKSSGFPESFFEVERSEMGWSRAFDTPPRVPTPTPWAATSPDSSSSSSTTTPGDSSYGGSSDIEATKNRMYLYMEIQEGYTTENNELEYAKDLIHKRNNGEDLTSEERKHLSEIQVTYLPDASADEINSIGTYETKIEYNESRINHYQTTKVEPKLDTIHRVEEERREAALQEAAAQVVAAPETAQVAESSAPISSVPETAQVAEPSAPISSPPVTSAPESSAPVVSAPETAQESETQGAETAQESETQGAETAQESENKETVHQQSSNQQGSLLEEYADLSTEFADYMGGDD